MNNSLGQAGQKDSTFKIIMSALSLTVLFRAFRQLLSGKSSLYYEDLGFDVVEGVGPKAEADENIQLWQNCGYWVGTSSYDEACKRLVYKVGELAGLSPSVTLLDVGFGFGEQDLYWEKEFDVKKIIGINITPFQVDFAAKRAAQRALSDKIDYRVGDAVNIDLPGNSVDVVICLQSAFQFDTRGQFFKEAYRVLKAGGVLVTADMIPTERMSRKPSVWAWVTRRRVGWPHQNNYPASQYARYLEDAGFSTVAIESIRDRVFPGMKEYIRRRYNGERDSEIRINVEELESGQSASSLWKLHYGVDDFVLVKATKER